MKKLVSTLLLVSIMLTGCAKQPEHIRYTATGRYYTDGTVITDDGYIWGYSTDTISDKPAEDNMPVFVAFDDNSTPDDITDDIILGLVWDVETAIYDDLKSSLSQTFIIERNGNHIHIKGE